MKKPSPISKISTGVPNLDEILLGGLPQRSVIVFAGQPGSGKTILSQMIGFHNATVEAPVVFFQTLSEPTSKTLTFASQFNFFDLEKVGKCAYFIDLGDILRTQGVDGAINLLVNHIKQIRPALVVIDSFKAFEDLAHTPEKLRKFSYEVAIQLMAWECTSLLLGEYGKQELETSPLFSIVDGIILLSQRRESDEQQRFLQVIKMRGTDHDRDEHSALISESGLNVYAPRVSLKRIPKSDEMAPLSQRLKTGVQILDHLIPEGIPRGSSCLISGVSGTGKSLLGLEFIYRGAAEFNEKGIIFLFEETTERVLAAAKKMNWDLAREMSRGMIEIVYIPQTDILVDMHLVMIHDTVVKIGAKRVVIDSTSVFLYKTPAENIVREKIYHLATLVQNAGAVGFFVTDVPAGSNQLSRYNVEETVVDGVILLTSEKIGQKRQRHLEVYKLRNTNHASGAYPVTIDSGGITGTI
jgi:circadian clock protein KaiC